MQIHIDSIVQMPLARIESSSYRARGRLHEVIDRIVRPLNTIALLKLKSTFKTLSTLRWSSLCVGNSPDQIDRRECEALRALRSVVESTYEHTI